MKTISMASKHTRLSLALIAAGLMLGAQAQDLPTAPTAVARVVTDGKVGSPEDLIFSIALASGEQLRGISLDDNGLVTSLNSQFVLIGQAGGISSFRLSPAIDFESFVGYSATLKLSIAGPNGARSVSLPIQVSPLSAITEPLSIRQAVADDANSFVPQWPLRQAGDVSLTGVQTLDEVAFAYQLSTDVGGRLIATAQAPLALPQSTLGLRISRQVTPSGQSATQAITLSPVTFSSLNVSQDIQPEAGASGLRFIVPGAWNTEVQDLFFADQPGVSILSRFRLENLDNGDTRFTLLPQQSLTDHGYPDKALNVLLQRSFSGTTGQQALRLLPVATSSGAKASANGSNGASADGALATGTKAASNTASKTDVASTVAIPLVAVVPPQPNQSQAKVKSAARANSFAATRPLTGDITQFQYDAVGNLTQTTDPLGRVTQNTYDALNRVIQTTLPTFNSGTPTITYAYDGQDHLIQVTDPRSLITRYQIDGLGNLTQIVSPDSGITQQGQDIVGNLVSKTDARGQTQTRSYDLLYRLTKIVYNGATGNQLAQVQYGYDQGSNAIGRLSSVTELDAAGNTLNLTRYAYDSMGRLSQETRTLPGGNPTTISYSHAVGGAISSITMPSGRVVTYTRDAAGRVSAIDTTVDGQTQSVVSGVSYQPFGGVKSYALGNGQVVTRTQDTQGRINSYTLAGILQPISYDPASRITSIGSDPATKGSYAFDNLDHLTSASNGAVTQSFSYDANGNRLTRQLGAQSTQYNIDPASNRITSASSASYQYDAAGNLLNDGSRQFSYDSRGRLTQAILAAAPSQYQVDAAGRRVRKSIGTAQEVVFHYDLAGHLIAESHADGSVIRETLYLLDIPVAVFQ